MARTTAATLTILIASVVLGGCSAPRLSDRELGNLEQEIDLAIDDFIDEDRGMRAWFEDSYGYAIFPNVGKGGIGVGGAYGEGLVYELGDAIGTSALTQATIGFQLGGQSYQQVIFFEDVRALEVFISGDFEFGAQASAVAATAGASADADFNRGMATFTAQNGGLMYEASLGGQKFSFRPLARELERSRSE